MSAYELGTFFEAAFADRPPPTETQTVVAITAEETTARSVAQQSRFTIHGTRRPLDELDGQSSFLRRWMVPGGAKSSIAKQLSRAGILEHRLFPDLDHLAQWVESRCFCGQDPCPHQGTKPGTGLNRDSV